ncbi:MAG TPA: ClbS/DfsB family four-helix bundle protein [Herpetosiphon sp.]|uniref:DinB-like domain-containing protein n=1 Tax=Herpetosiphon aurantiacus (strain ATCC 23779 / DSM 785 / 114-95) TaxID=316274 RepID=A9AX83_HERA2|nr:ClbS/DfsB family four-helix bundle protein [Herpetosiphon sp.]ABX06803.1 hypothetical protein Haur_4171 [Herpetosiphon aurantiacus DSM 785]HBW52388.1 ClbS/DfsB family four-helix bundle protein [Herpetosiphon sp.]
MSQFDDQDAITVVNLQARIAAGWQELQTFLQGLSHTQLTNPTDAAGWTIKDHAIHLALWENSLLALLKAESRAASFGLDEAVWQQGYEAVNRILQQRYHDLPLDQVFATLETNHQTLLAYISQLSDSDLMRPHREFQAGSTNDEPIIGWIVGNTFEHYAEHLPWMQAILDS